MRPPLTPAGDAPSGIRGTDSRLLATHSQPSINIDNEVVDGAYTG